MAFRLAAQRSSSLSRVASPAARVLSARLAPAPAAASVRFYSDKPSPEAKASSLLDALPGNSLISKTGWVTLGTGATALAVSNELYVANEETVIAVGFLVFATLVGRAVTGPYKEWADSQIEKIGGILNGARKEHTDAVQARIDSVSQQKDVVDITKSLYSIAKETAQTEKEVFELSQRTKIASEVKAVLDSWVRFEAQEREAEQRLLTEAVVRKVQDALNDDKMQKQILDNAIAEVEQLVKAKKL
ncbi:putative H+-transporting two-sector ATPase chain b precursor, mitochondrial [Tilletiaria anomala UBC 951]|uniref:ATP synthase subunit 4 n=1 Tax=Tilletiaria anomala (strain ATCC 24038 / CBS 436.72 / UBC 951) TaxID=1037660 RepID=A0A066VPI8_TILAU|nr:putative H+-transporting two-sector ATPase chain b precursor, mitochondrial [Tilletiaria anomala UBC 951]KDN43667.1 putative H+-transporting two-sector ATPase chain b precursor, mitochondrial [Tilletiaria anomala UBC 951]